MSDRHLSFLSFNPNQFSASSQAEQPAISSQYRPERRRHNKDTSLRSAVASRRTTRTKAVWSDLPQSHFDSLMHVELYLSSKRKKQHTNNVCVRDDRDVHVMSRSPSLIAHVAAKQPVFLVLEYQRRFQQCRVEVQLSLDRNRVTFATIFIPIIEACARRFSETRVSKDGVQMLHIVFDNKRGSFPMTCKKPRLRSKKPRSCSKKPSTPLPRPSAAVSGVPNLPPVPFEAVLGSPDLPPIPFAPLSEDSPSTPLPLWTLDDPLFAALFPPTVDEATSSVNVVGVSII